MELLQRSSSLRSASFLNLLISDLNSAYGLIFARALYLSVLGQVLLSKCSYSLAIDSSDFFTDISGAVFSSERWRFLGLPLLPLLLPCL